MNAHRATRWLFAVAVTVTTGTVLAQESTPLYLDSSAPLQARVKDLLGRMTLEEKLGQMRGAWCQTTEQAITKAVDEKIGFIVLNTVERQLAEKAAEEANRLFAEVRNRSHLKLAPVLVNGGVNGLLCEGASEFPCGIGLAATWNPTLAGDIGRICGNEVRARGETLFVSPRLYLTTDPRTGRVEEGLGEDPWLMSRLAVAFVRAVQGQRVISAPCLFPTEFGPGGRLCDGVEISERDLRERYCPPFEAAIREGGAAAIMPCYGSINGQPAHGSAWLLNTVLRKEWCFDGIVVSDYNAGWVIGARLGIADPVVRMITAGVNVDLPYSQTYGKSLDDAIRDGRVPVARIDALVAEILRTKIRFGLVDFDGLTLDPQKCKALPESPETRRVALEAARQSMVLLKNQNRTLPFGSGIKKVAIMGPMSDVRPLGGYTGCPLRVVCATEGLKACGQVEVVAVKHAGIPPRWRVIDPELLFKDPDASHAGLTATLFAGGKPGGSPVGSIDVKTLSFDWAKDLPSPLRGKPFCLRIEGYLKYPPVITACNLRVNGTQTVRLLIAGQPVIDGHPGNSTEPSSPMEHTGNIKLEQGNVYPFVFECTPGPGEEKTALQWIFNKELGSDRFETGETEVAQCIEAAKAADAAVVCVGIVEGEAKDRSDLRLPGNQEKLIQEIAALGKPTIVVLIAGNVVEMIDWLPAVQGVVAAWYPGMEGGTALADLLFGKVNFSGKLPLSFLKRTGQAPMPYNRQPSARDGQYADVDGDPMFPFGFGLGYTSFRYGNLRVSPQELKAGQTLRVSFDLENLGDRDGTEVAQLYTRSWKTSVVRPILELRSFDRISLKAGERRNVTFQLPADQLKYYGIDPASGKLLGNILEPHELQIKVGSSSRHVQLETVVGVQ